MLPFEAGFQAGLTKEAGFFGIGSNLKSLAMLGGMGALGLGGMWAAKKYLGPMPTEGSPATDKSTPAAPAATQAAPDPVTQAADKEIKPIPVTNTATAGQAVKGVANSVGKGVTSLGNPAVFNRPAVTRADAKDIRPVAVPAAPAAVSKPDTKIRPIVPVGGGFTAQQDKEYNAPGGRPITEADLKG